LCPAAVKGKVTLEASSSHCGPTLLAFHLNWWRGWLRSNRSMSGQSDFCDHFLFSSLKTPSKRKSTRYDLSSWWAIIFWTAKTDIKSNRHVELPWKSARAFLAHRGEPALFSSLWSSTLIRHTAIASVSST
jgi:hypothetical protein